MARARLSGSARVIRPLPVKLLSGALLFTVALLAALGWFASTTHSNFQRAYAAHTRLKTLISAIAYLDEVVHMSAYVAAATGDLWWEHRYRRFEPRLRAAVQEAAGLAPEPFMSQAAARADAAKVKLVAMEDRALKLLHQGDRDAALTVLAGEEYKRQKAAYAEGRREVGAHVERHLRAALLGRRRAAKYALVSTGVALPLLVLVWLGVVKMVKAYISEHQRAEEVLQQARDELERLVWERTGELRGANEALSREVTERREAQLDLQKAHAELEERVVERTAELSGANASLKQEIVRRRRAEEELQAAKQVAEDASRAKSDFLAGMSHELRTPLNAIIGFSQVLQEQYFGALNEQQADYVNDILESGQHLLSLISDILDLSKVEAGKMTLNLSRVNICDLVQRSTTMIKEKCLKHGIGLEVDVPEALRDLEIAADERKIKQVVFNLLSNAGKFTPDGGAIAIDVRQSGREVIISVSDTGIGIPAEEQKKIFEEFYQTAAGSAAKAPGTGLGLSLVKQLVKLHGGKVWVKSEGRGKGSRFSFALPMAVPGAKEESTEAEPPEVNVISTANDLLACLGDVIADSRAANRQFTLCRLQTEPELSKTEAVAMARDILEEKRPDDYLAIDWNGHIHLVLHAIDAEQAKIPLGRIIRRAAGALGQVDVTYTTATFPEDGETADALVKKVSGARSKAGELNVGVLTDA